MSIQNERINKALSPAELTAIRTKINELEDELPFLIGLTVEERVALPKINDANRTFVMDSLQAVKSNSSFMPAYINSVNLENDVTLYNQLEEFVQRIGQLYEKILDTQTLAGSEAYMMALAAYKMFQAASAAGLPGADAIHDALKQRFAGQGGTGTGENPAPPTP